MIVKGHHINLYRSSKDRSNRLPIFLSNNKSMLTENIWSRIVSAVEGKIFDSPFKHSDTVYIVIVYVCVTLQCLYWMETPGQISQYISL